jgi:Putative zinc-finger
MTAGCIGEPVSWLRLEQWRLGELAEAERARVTEHVAACPLCAACAAHIEADEAIDLPVLARQPAALVRPRRSRGLRLLTSAGALAAAAAAIVVVASTRHGTNPAVVDRGETVRPKGDAVAFVLVRDDGERVTEAQGVYRSGDRFKALVTCAPGASLTFELVVFDAEGTSFPLQPARALACGNEVPLPGAFRLTSPAEGSGAESVCLVWGEGDEVDREALARSGVPGPRALCKELVPGE